MTLRPDLLLRASAVDHKTEIVIGLFWPMCVLYLCMSIERNVDRLAIASSHTSPFCCASFALLSADQCYNFCFVCSLFCFPKIIQLTGHSNIKKVFCRSVLLYPKLFLLHFLALFELLLIRLRLNKGCS